MRLPWKEMRIRKRLTSSSKVTIQRNKKNQSLLSKRKENLVGVVEILKNKTIASLLETTKSYYIILRNAI